MTLRVPRVRLAQMSEDQMPHAEMRIVLELTSEGGTVSGTLTSANGSRSFWGWLELMSALELAAGTSPGQELANR